MITNQDKNTCPHNEGVVCGPYDVNGRRVERNCESCSWNPKVAKARLAKYYRENGIMPIMSGQESK